MNREIYYDQLRVIAIISIICCHVCCDFLYLNPAIMTHFKTFYFISFFTLGRFVGIPIFVMLSGALLINKKYSFKDYFKKRFKRVFIPYIFWAIIFILFSVYINKELLTTNLFWDIILGHHGCIGVILWFIWMILIVYVAIFIINNLLELGKSYFDKFENKFINILTLASFLVYFLINFGFFSYSGDFSYYLLFIPYAIFGYYLTHVEFTLSKITPDIIVVLTFMLSIVSYLYFIFSVDVTSINLNEFSAGSYFQFIVMIITFSIILFFRYLPKSNLKLFKKVNILLSSNIMMNINLSISKCSFGIYFIHYLILKYIQSNYLKPIKFYNHPIFWTPLLLIIIFLSSWGVIYVLSKIPIIKVLSGSV